MIYKLCDDLCCGYSNYQLFSRIVYENVRVTKTLRPKNDGHFLKWISWKETVLCIDSNFTEFVNRGQIDNNSSLGQVMAWRRIGAKPLPDPITMELDHCGTSALPCLRREELLLCKSPWCLSGRYETIR